MQVGSIFPFFVFLYLKNLVVHNRSQAAHKRSREVSATENIENPNNGIGQELSPPLKINAVSVCYYTVCWTVGGIRTKSF